MPNRMELSKTESTRYNKSFINTAAIERLSVGLFFEAQGKPGASRRHPGRARD